MSHPMISVVMPVYNGEKYLNEAIDSILNQTYSDFEFIILNDGSTDRTEEIILSYNDPRIIYVKNEKNLQIVKTLNKGIDLAKGEYIARMDADDISMPERFEKQVELMEKNPDIDVCGTGYTSFGDKNIIFTPLKEHKNIEVKLLFTSPFAHPTIMMKKKIFHTYQYLDMCPKAEDYALWIQLFRKYTFANIPETLLYYRIHDNQTTIKQGTLQLLSTRKAMIKYLEFLTINASETDVILHQNIALKKKVAVDTAEQWFLKLLNQNNKVLLVNQAILEENIFELWKYQCFSQTSIGIKRLQTFYGSKLYIPKKLSLLQHIKFIIKCFIKYTKN